ncbi:MAG: glycosyltransferase family 39 protein, partial [Anaerolineales bacterium]|nr:glycosyltransferase family 39 protein [Anaerolineales bacterium]
MKTVHREWLLVGLLLLIMVVKGLLWSLAFPLWQGPDEDDHYAVIQFIAENGRLPDVNDTFLPDEVALSREIADVGRLDYAPEQRQAWSDTAVGLNEAQFAQLPVTKRASFDTGITGKLMKGTPFYYMLGAGVYRLFPDGDLLTRVFVQRFFATLMSSPLVVVAYLIARLLFPTDAATHSMMRLTVPTLVAFHPLITEITAIVSVDGFYNVCYALLIYLTLRLLRDQFTWKLGTAIGLTFAIGLLTKPT